VAALALTQHRILAQCLKLLKPGGRLLYSTCSILPAENERIVQAVLAAEPRARSLPLTDGVTLPADCLERSVGMQLLPGNAALTDGFYYACLTVT
jgi:16S rRNA (cytosine967-C5)-methyltransferase